MTPEVTLRTLILTVWLAALLLPAELDLRSGLLAGALALLWAAPLARDRIRARAVAGRHA